MEPRFGPTAATATSNSQPKYSGTAHTWNYTAVGIVIAGLETLSLTSRAMRHYRRHHTSTAHAKMGPAAICHFSRNSKVNGVVFRTQSAMSNDVEDGEAKPELLTSQPINQIARTLGH